MTKEGQPKSGLRKFAEAVKGPAIVSGVIIGGFSAIGLLAVFTDGPYVRGEKPWCASSQLKDNVVRIACTRSFTGAGNKDQYNAEVAELARISQKCPVISRSDYSDGTTNYYIDIITANTNCLAGESLASR